MPIIEIAPVLSESISPDYSILEAQIKEAVAFFPGLRNIAYEEVMIHIAGNQYKASSNFIYVKVWIYRRDHRVRKLLSSVQKEIGIIVHSFFEKQMSGPVMVEVLPFMELIDQDCFVSGNLSSL